MTTAGKIVKNSYLSIGAELGATVGMGAASLIGYKMVQSSVSPNRSQGSIFVNADKIKGKGSVYLCSKNNLMVEKFLNNNNSNNSENNITYNILELDV